MTASGIIKFFEKNIRSGENIFHEIARENSLWMLRRITHTVNENIDFLLRESNDRGETCIHIAANGRSEKTTIAMIEMFVRLGADINARNITGETPLHYAVCNDNCQLIQWLCEQESIDLNAMNQHLLTPYELAIIRNSKDAANILKYYYDLKFAKSGNDKTDGDWPVPVLTCLRANEERSHADKSLLSSTCEKEDK
uniref:AsIV-cont00051-ORF1 n=1 Tax=Apophua simplicipes ichnovirus TaxID=1329648 RepID=S5DMJ5_9VIRU|nr:AsIV-cont00051-ORF1 [Apophua simplicipes ichnovirus]